MGGAIQSKLQDLQTLRNKPTEDEIPEKQSITILITPLAKAIEHKQWGLITSIVDADSTALYTPIEDGTLPLQNAIKQQAPFKVLSKLTRRSARIQIPRPVKIVEDDVANDDVDQEKQPTEPTATPKSPKSPKSPLPDPLTPLPPIIPLPPLTLSPPTSPSISTTYPPTPILPITTTDPISFPHKRHHLGLLQLLLTKIKTEEQTIKLVDIVLDERRKNETKRISVVDNKNLKITKKNSKTRKKKKHKALFSTTPKNPLLQEVAAHGNTPLHIAVVRGFAPAFQQRLMNVDNHGFDLTLTEESRFNCAALTPSIKGHLPLHLACRGPFSGQYKVKHPYTIIEQLIKHRPTATQIKTKKGRLALHLVLRAKANKSIVQLILETYPEAASIPTTNGNYALHVAIWNCHPPSVIRLILSHYPKAAGIISPSSNMYPIDLALEKDLNKKIIALLIKEASKAAKEDKDRSRPTTSISSKNRLKRIMPKVWRKYHASTTVQSKLRRIIHQSKYNTLQHSCLTLQPWIRGCLSRKRQILNQRIISLEHIQLWVRMCLSKKKLNRRKWAIEEIHNWILDFTWMRPIIDARVLRRETCIPETTDDFMHEIYQKIAERRDAGETIVKLLRVGYLSAKEKHGYYRALQAINVRHASATLINQRVWKWVKYVKMKRAFKPLLANQILRVWFRKIYQNHSLYIRKRSNKYHNLQLQSNVAAVRFQSVGRSYLSRRYHLENKSCVKIQAWYRFLKTWRKYKIMRYSAIQISKIRRSSVVRHKYWWIQTPGASVWNGRHRSQKFEKQARKIAYPTREGFDSNPANGHHILPTNHLFVKDRDRIEHSRLKLRMFLATH